MKAKKKSSQYKRFKSKYGDYAWELEALPPETLQKILEDKIDAVIDTKAFNHEIDQERADATELEGMRHVVMEAFKGAGWEE